MEKLYSFRGMEPKELPNRIRMPDGFTKTDKTTFTDEDISLAGYFLVTESKPVITDPNQLVVWDMDKWIIVDITPVDDSEIT